MTELLESPLYRAWLLKEPKNVPQQGISSPWYLYIQRENEGGWGRKAFDSYDEAVELLLKKADSFYDLALRSQRRQYGPPIRVKKSVDKKGIVYKTRMKWKIPEGHLWCGYCRRPTVFRKFAKHHAFNNEKYRGLLDPTIKRCTICAIRRDSIMGHN